MEVIKDIFVAASIYAHIFMSGVIVLGILALARAYRMPKGETRYSAVWYFSQSIMDLAVSVGIAVNAIGFWVLWRVYFSPDPMLFLDGWPLIAVGFTFDTLFLRGIYRGLRAVQVSLHDRLPAHERHLWPWWAAWLYPDRIRMFPTGRQG